MNRLLFRALVLLFLVVSPCQVFATTGSCTVTWTSVTPTIGCVTYSWVGNVSGGTVPATSSGTDINGYVIMVETNPGSTAPTDDYDITLTDEDGADILGGEGADRDTANTECVVPKIDSVYGERIVEGTATLNISGQSVNSATGVVKVYFRK